MIFISSPDYLRKIPIFSRLCPELLSQIHSKTIEKLYQKGVTVFREGEPGEGFHYLRSGKIKIIKLSEDGREHIIHILQPGDLFAEVLLFRSGNYPCTAVAVEDSYVGIIKNTDLEQLVLNNNQLALEIIKALSARLLFAQQKIKNLALDDVLARMADTLLQLANQQGKKLPDGKIELLLNISRQELAGLIGTTRETANRTLSMLKKEKLLEFNGKKIILTKPDQLSQLIDFSGCHCLK